MLNIITHPAEHLHGEAGTPAVPQKQGAGREAAHLYTGRVKPLDAPFGPKEPDSHFTSKRQESWSGEIVKEVPDSRTSGTEHGLKRIMLRHIPMAFQMILKALKWGRGREKDHIQTNGVRLQSDFYWAC